MKVRFIPMDNQVIVQPNKKAKVTAGGLIIPDTVKSEDDPVAKIISIGPDVKKYKVGDSIIASQHGPMKLPGPDGYYILNENIIVCKVMVVS